VYWIEDMGDQKGALYLTAVKEDSDAFATALNFAVVERRIREKFNAIEIECINISNSLFLAEQYSRILLLTDEIRALREELHRLEAKTPDATTEINQVRSALRIRKMALNRETEILNRLKEASADS
jgi:hypothetical protein